MTGGGARSDVWLSVKADILNLPVTALSSGEIGSAGTAKTAGCAIGIYDEGSVPAKPEKTFYPNKERHAFYEKQFRKYKKIYALSKEVLRGE